MESHSWLSRGTWPRRRSARQRGVCGEAPVRSVAAGSTSRRAVVLVLGAVGSSHGAQASHTVQASAGRPCDTPRQSHGQLSDLANASSSRACTRVPPLRASSLNRVCLPGPSAHVLRLLFQFLLTHAGHSLIHVFQPSSLPQIFWILPASRNRSDQCRVEHARLLHFPCVLSVIQPQVISFKFTGGTFDFR